jgi:hypothetical protein
MIFGDIREVILRGYPAVWFGDNGSSRDAGFRSWGNTSNSFMNINEYVGFIDDFPEVNERK